ncbi:hypothetical protein P879_01944 [Paragonimus westermani]|uniref:Uncharacterized protein n=1 Tax=Paragonimus westermani TaxID=34504 RepID=A0A8T0DSP8_9TREM|nr:hypothetical protein P879_01944 [Paragonimus westermani]
MLAKHAASSYCATKLKVFDFNVTLLYRNAEERLGELQDSFKFRRLTSPTFTGKEKRLDYVFQTVHLLSIRLKRVECKLDISTAKGRKLHAEDVKIAVSCADFRLPLALEVEVMQLQTKLGESDMRDKQIIYLFESRLFSGALVVNLRWSTLCRSGSTHIGESYLCNFFTQLECTGTLGSRVN